MLADVAIGLIVFLLLRFAGQLIRVALLLRVLLLQLGLLLVVDGPYLRTRHTMLFALVLAGNSLWHLYGPRSA